MVRSKNTKYFLYKIFLTIQLQKCVLSSQYKNKNKVAMIHTNKAKMYLIQEQLALNCFSVFEQR